MVKTASSPPAPNPMSDKSQKLNESLVEITCLDMEISHFSAAIDHLKHYQSSAPDAQL